MNSTNSEMDLSLIKAKWKEMNQLERSVYKSDGVGGVAGPSNAAATGTSGAQAGQEREDPNRRSSTASNKLKRGQSNNNIEGHEIEKRKLAWYSVQYSLRYYY